MRKSNKSVHSKAGVKGMFRLNIINPDGSIAGDSGWCKNIITNSGYQQFLMYLLMASAGSLRPAFAALGTAGTPASSDATLVNQLTETNAKPALTTGSSGSKTVVYTFTLNSGTIAAASTIMNVGLYWYTVSSQVNANGTLMAGSTFASSSLATNQAVNFWQLLLETVVQKLLKFGEHLFETIPSQTLLLERV